MAFLDAAKKAQPILLEPIVNVTIIVPPASVSAARATFVTRGYRTLQVTGPVWSALSTRMPLVETLGLATEVRHRTRGHGQVGIRLAGYGPATRADDYGDRDTPVREPRPPRTPPRLLRAAVPEPADDALDDDAPFAPRGLFRT
jgi:translation elongation factor EF-G